ncbi:MAG: hypothetical protein Q9M30_05790, partial [Mariprofundaceae bacterium]|nr:hypothetical protein [Mariprofundaceae bacterium]
AMHYALGKEAKHLLKLDAGTAGETARLSPSSNATLSQAIAKAWDKHETDFNGLPGESEWGSYLRFITDVEIQQSNKDESAHSSAPDSTAAYLEAIKKTGRKTGPFKGITQEKN